MNKIPLGSRVRCVLSGLTGIAATETLQINGNIRYDVQPKSEDGKSMPEAWVIDVQSLEVVDAGISERATAPRAHTFNTGDKVIDQITGHEGIVTELVTFLNGCVFANVVPRKSGNALLTDAAPAGSMLPVERLKYIGKGLTIPATDKPTGGPSARAVRI